MKKIMHEVQAIRNLLALQTQLSKPFFNVSETARYLNISEDAVYKLMAAQKLKYSKPNGKIVYIQRSECDRYVRLNTVRRIDEIEEEAKLRTQKRRRSC